MLTSSRRAICLLSLLFGLSLGLACSDDDVTPGNPTPDMSAPDTASDLDTSPDTPHTPPDMGPPDLPPPPPDALPDFDFPDDDMAPAIFALEQVIPPEGGVEGGLNVRLSGSLLQEGTRVFFGSREMAVRVSAAGLAGETPPGVSPGLVDVKAISPSGEESVLVGGFRYVDPLRIDAVTPSRVLTTGGVEVEVRGSGFDARAGVSFSGDSALRVSYISSALLRVVTPPRAAGPADVRVTTPSGAVTLPSGVRYEVALRLDEVRPASDLTAGGAQVTLQGAGFGPNTQVAFGESSAQVISHTPETLVVSAPAHPQGLVAITVTDALGAARLDDAFLYRADDSPQLAAVQPAIGPDAGGQEVVITGYGLDAPARTLWFASQPAQIVSRELTQARVITPAGAIGAVDVSLRDNAQTLDVLADAYTYAAAVQLDAVTPDRGPVEGGTRVVLRGSGLEQVSRVSFGGLPATFEVSSDAELVVTSPAHASGPVDVVVERGPLRDTLTSGFTYEQPLEIWGFTPTRGSISGGTYVEVRGVGFHGALSATLGGVAATRLQRLDRNNLSFYTPANVSGDAQLRVSGPAGQAQGPYPFRYFNPTARFGGASGGEVNGAVNVSVFSTVGGEPIPGAFVMLSARPDTAYQGITNANGLVTLSGPGVLGAQTVTAAAAGFSTTTVQSVDAENITILLSQLNPTPGNGSGGGNSAPPPFATIRGRIETLGKLDDDGDERAYEMAVVSTTTPSPHGGNPAPGPGAVVLGSGQFEITSRVGDLAAIALCGTFSERDQRFTPQFMAVQRFLFLSDQQVMENLTLRCDIPLDQQLPVKLVGPVYMPDGPNINRVTATWSFGFEGYFSHPFEARSASELLSLRGLPAREGVLADLTWDLRGGSYTGTFSPLTESRLRALDDLTRPLTLPPLLDVPEPVSPQPGGVIVNRELRWQSSGPHLPDAYVVTLRDERGLPVWTFITPGDVTSVTIPQLPDLSAMPPEVRPAPYVRGTLFLTINAFRRDGAFSFDAFTYEDLANERWEANAINRWAVSFP